MRQVGSHSEPSDADTESAHTSLRTLRAQIGDATPLTSTQRKSLLGKIRASNPILQASINVIGALEA